MCAVETVSGQHTAVRAPGGEAGKAPGVAEGRLDRQLSHRQHIGF